MAMVKNNITAVAATTTSNPRALIKPGNYMPTAFDLEPSAEDLEGKLPLNYRNKDKSEAILVELPEGIFIFHISSGMLQHCKKLSVFPYWLIVKTASDGYSVAYQQTSKPVEEPAVEEQTETGKKKTKELAL